MSTEEVDHATAIVENSIGYVGRPPPAVGDRVWRMSPA